MHLEDRNNRSLYAPGVSVCRAFRDYFNRNKLFWNTIRYKYGDDIACFKLFLQRSNNAPLTITMEVEAGSWETPFYQYRPPTAAVQELATNHLHRCVELDIAFSRSSDWFRIGMGSASQLMHLTIRALHRGDPPIGFCSSFAPNLEYLTVNGTYTKWESLIGPSLIGFSGLELCLPHRSGFNRLIESFNSAPNLKCLKLSIQRNSNICPTALVTLPQLTQLIICGQSTYAPSILGALSTPALTHLGLHDIRLRARNFGFSDMQLTSLTHLEVWNTTPVDEESWAALSLWAPFITHLSTNSSLFHLSSASHLASKPIFSRLNRVVVGEMSGRQASAFLAMREMDMRLHDISPLHLQTLRILNSDDEFDWYRRLLPISICAIEDQVR